MLADVSPLGTLLDALSLECVDTFLMYFVPSQHPPLDALPPTALQDSLLIQSSSSSLPLVPKFDHSRTILRDFLRFQLTLMPSFP